MIFLFFVSCIVSAVQSECRGFTWAYTRPSDYSRGRSWRGTAYTRAGYLGTFTHDCFGESMPSSTGDTSCNVFMPVSCYDSNSFISEPPQSWYDNLKNKSSIWSSDAGSCTSNCNRYSGHEIKLTEKEYNGHCFPTGPADVDTVCAAEFGPGWKSTHHNYDGVRGTAHTSFFGGYMTKPVTGYIRVWSYVAGITSNPWNSGAEWVLCADRPADWAKWTDQCWARHPCPGFEACHDPDTSVLGPVVCGTCDDGIKNQAEFGVDCGPVCGNTCPSGTCMDGLRNGDELAVDCGGSCKNPCPPSCSDGILNNGEQFVDCGGPNCPSCLPSCWDSVQNGEETGQDCGGACAPCDVDPCKNGFQDGNEEDIDCGGRCSFPCLFKPSIDDSTFVYHYSCEGFRSCPYFASNLDNVWICSADLPFSDLVNPPFDPMNAVTIIALDTSIPTTNVIMTDNDLTSSTTSSLSTLKSSTTFSLPTLRHFLSTKPLFSSSNKANYNEQTFSMHIEVPVPPAGPDYTFLFVIAGFIALLTVTFLFFLVMYRKQRMSLTKAVPLPAMEMNHPVRRSRTHTRTSRSCSLTHSRSRRSSVTLATKKTDPATYVELNLSAPEYVEMKVLSNKRSSGYDATDSVFCNGSSSAVSPDASVYSQVPVRSEYTRPPPPSNITNICSFTESSNIYVH